MANNRHCRRYSPFRAPVQSIALQNVLGALIYIMSTGSAFADVPPECSTLYLENGARPFTDSCYTDAATATVNLGNYQCLANPEVVEEFCSTLGDYDDCQRAPSCRGGGDGGDEDGGDDGEEEGDNGGNEEGGDGGDEESGDGGSDGGDNGNGDGPEPLGEFEEDQESVGQVDEEEGLESDDPTGGTSDGSDTLGAFDEDPGNGGSDGLCSGPDLLAWNGNFDAIFGPGLGLLDLPGNLPGYDVAAAAVSISNIIEARDYAERTGDSRPLLEAVRSAYLPFGLGKEFFERFATGMDQMSGRPRICP